MNISEQFRLQIVNRVLIVSLTIFLSCALIFGVRGGIAAQSARVLESSSVRDKANWQKLKKEVDDISNRSAVSAPESNQAVVQLQSHIQKAAQDASVRVEFDSVADPQVYVTRYAADTNADGYKCMDMQITLTGNYRSVVDVLGHFASFPVFFEFGPLDLSRNPPNKDGTSNVRASLSVRLMYRE
jgi:hypothetical protein